MQEYYSLYVMVDCEESKQAIALLQEKQKLFLTIVMDKNPLFAEMIKNDMKIDNTPIVVQQLEDSSIKIIGGLKELETHLLKG
jgi:arsenate reductase-like glutaredoxin family protein